MGLKFLSDVVSFLIFLVNILCSSKLPIVQVEEGLLQGKFGTSRDGRIFNQFLGVPYAYVPTRFEVSVPVTKWEGIRPATEFGPSCSGLRPEDESVCLNLNIFTPRLNNNNFRQTNLLPTLIYIHGGSFQYGSNANFGPNYFMDEDIVLVVINYRLGALGFLSTGDEVVPGNNGLKDQVMALKWVQRNIVHFGGDKNRVTIMGQSAGSASVTYHLVSPMSKGLFQNAIAQSGTFLDPWAFTRNPIQYTQELAKLCECSITGSTLEMIECLQKIPASKFGEYRDQVVAKFFVDPLAGFAPVIERVKPGKHSSAFLSQSPYDLLIKGQVNKVPLLTGVTKVEGIYLWAGPILYGTQNISIIARTQLLNNWTAVAPAALYYDEVLPKDQWDQVASKIRNFYFGSKSIDKSTFSNLANLYTDRLFVNSATKFINLYSKHSGAPIYPYLYTCNKYMGLEYLPEWDHLSIGKEQKIEATHAAELDMLFSPLFTTTRKEADHIPLSKKIVKLWMSFISTGVPIATFGSAKAFPAVNETDGFIHWYQLDTDTKLLPNHFRNRTKFWKSLNLLDNNFSVNPGNNRQ